MELNFTYPGAEKKALGNISLTLNEGEVLCLCGRTGCGKSTFLRMLKPLIAPHGTLTGQIRFFDKDVKEMTPEEQVEYWKERAIYAEAEAEYLKKLHAVVQARKARQRKKK